MLLKKYKVEIIIFFIVFTVYSFFTLLKITNGLPPENLAADQYFQIAENIVNSRFFSLDGLSPTALRMPGYPLFLAVFFKLFQNWWVILFLQHLISAMSAVLLYIIAKRWARPAWAATVSFIWAFEPYSIDISSQFLTETIYTFILLAFIFIFLKYGDNLFEKKIIVMLSFMSAMLIYIKPISLFLPIVFAVALLYPKLTKKSLTRIACFFILIFIFLFPWLLRNYLVFGSWQLSSDNASSLYITSLLFQADKQGLKHLPEIPKTDEFPKFIESGNLSKTTPEIKKASQIILSEPFSFAKFYIKNLSIGVTGSSWWGSTRNLLKGSSGQVNYHKEVVSAVFDFDKNKIFNFSPKEIGALIVMASGILFWSLILILAIIGAIFLFKNASSQTKPALILMIGIILYLILIGNLAAGDIIRYRFPASPFIVLFAAKGLLFIAKKDKIKII